MPAPPSESTTSRSHTTGENTPSRGTARTRWLLLLCSVLVVHGSLYPWHLDNMFSVAAAWSRLWSGAGWWTSVGDVVGNVVLFVPMGLLAEAAWPAAARHRWGRSGLIWLACVLFAFALQVLQFWVPERSAAISDVIWNGVGAAIGQAGYKAWMRRVRPTERGGGRWPMPLVTMAVLWLALEWWPFLPTIDWQHMKNAIKPLLVAPRWSTASFVEVGLSVLVLAHLAKGRSGRFALVLSLVAAAAAGKLFLRGQVLSLGHVSGWVAGLVLAPALWRLGERASGVVVCLLALLWFSVDELRPFAWMDVPSGFGWLPFAASLRGSLLTNVLALCWQFYWLGAIIHTSRALGLRSTTAVWLLAAWTLMLEIHQAWLPGRSADITPALLPFIWWLASPWLQTAATGAGDADAHPHRPRTR